MDTSPPLTPVEEKVICIIGTTAVEGIAGAVDTAEKITSEKQVNKNDKAAKVNDTFKSADDLSDAGFFFKYNIFSGLSRSGNSN